MTLEGDDPNLVAVFTGHRMEAELIRSLLESNEIPAAIFGEGAYAFGADNVSTTERVMVRTDHLEAARAAIQEAGVLDEDGSVDVSADDGFKYADEEDEEGDDWDETGEAIDPQPLAHGSDWGPRLVGLLGVAALAVTVVVLVMKASG